jgi:hypothetical protein
MIFPPSFSVCSVCSVVKPFPARYGCLAPLFWLYGGGLKLVAALR